MFGVVCIGVFGSLGVVCNGGSGPLLAGSVGGSVGGGKPQIHLPQVEGVVLGFVRR